MTKKFSQFVDGENPRTTDIVVGLRDDLNTQFDFSGIKDQYGNQIVQWQAYNSSGRNYIRFINSPAGLPVAIQSQGVDASVGMAISSKSNGDLDLLAPGSGDINIVLGGAGDINMTTNAGKLILNETVGIDEILDEDNMVSNSATAVPTQQSTKAYVDASVGGLHDFTYITNTDETADLPNSFRLLGTANQITATNGTLSLSSTLLLPGTATLGGNLSVGTYRIISPSGTSIELAPDVDADGIDLASTIVRVENDIRHAGDETNKVSFTTAAQTYYIGGTSIMDINASGFRLDSGYRVSAISNDAAAFLDTELMTAYAIQTAIGNAIIGSNNFRGAWDASGGLFPTTGGTGPAGAVAAGNNWRISVGGTLGGEPVDQGDQIIAAVDVPGQTASNWIIVNPRVFSVFGRTGSVIAQSGDYPFNYITGLPSTATSGKIMRGDGSAWVESTPTFPNTANSGKLMRGDGSNWIESTPTFPNTAASGKLMRGDGTNWVESTPTYPNTANTGKILRGDGTNWVETTAQYPNTAGTSGNVLTSDGTNWVSSSPSSGQRALMMMNPATSAGSPFSFTTSYQEILGLATAYTLVNNTANFDMPSEGRLRYIGASPISIWVGFSILTTNKTFTFAIYKNAVTQLIELNTTGLAINLNNFKIDLVQNDYISIFGKRSAAGGEAIYNIQLFAVG
jgi:hypothetical protein